MRVLYSHVFLLFSSQREVDQFLFCGLLRRGRQTERWRRICYSVGAGRVSAESRILVLFAWPAHLFVAVFFMKVRVGASMLN